MSRLVLFQVDIGFDIGLQWEEVAGSEKEVIIRNYPNEKSEQNYGGSFTLYPGPKIPLLMTSAQIKIKTVYFYILRTYCRPP